MRQPCAERLCRLTVIERKQRRCRHPKPDVGHELHQSHNKWQHVRAPEDRPNLAVQFPFQNEKRKDGQPSDRFVISDQEKGKEQDQAKKRWQEMHVVFHIT